MDATLSEENTGGGELLPFRFMAQGGVVTGNDNGSDIHPGQTTSVLHGDGAETRAEKLKRLKAEIKAGVYQPDIKDIALQITRAMDPVV